jgi:hypothetical protein
MNNNNAIIPEVVPSDWSHIDEMALKNTELGNPLIVKKSKFVWFFVFGLVSLVLAFIFAYYQYGFNKNQVSNDKILITSDIKENMRAGESNLININLNNSNLIDLKDVKVNVTYQKGFTRQGEADIVSNNFYFGDVVPSVYYSTTTLISLIGSENDVRKFKIIITYKVQGSNAEFVKTLESSIKINNPTISLKINSPDKVLNENEITYNFIVKNLSLTEFPRSALIIETPPAFIIKKKSEIEDQKKIEIYNLKIGEEREYSITGYYKSSIGLTKIMKSNVSILDEKGEAGSSYAEDNKEITVENYPLTFEYKLTSNNSEGAYFELGKNNILELTLINADESAVTDLQMIIQNDLSKDVINLGGKEIESLNKVLPNEPTMIPVTIVNKNQGTYDYKIEIFGKLRGSFNTVLLSKGSISIDFKNPRSH